MNDQVNDQKPGDHSYQERNGDQFHESQQNGTEQLFPQISETHDDQLIDQNQSKSEEEQQISRQQSSQLSSSSSPISSSSTEQNNTNHHFAPRAKLFVGRLPENCSSKHLEDLFCKYGTVTECDVVGRYGFVFSTSKVHPEPGTLGRAKGISRMSKGIRPRIHNHTPYHRELYNNHRASVGPPHSVPLPPPHSHPAPVAPPGRLYVGYSQPYCPDSYRPYERDIYYDSDYYGRDRERHYPPIDHRATGVGGSVTANYDFDSRGYSPPPPSPLGHHPTPHHAPYPIYSSHRSLPIRAYERPVIDESMPMYSARGSPMTTHKCHYHKCHYDMHVKPYLN
ncbi:RNA-binding protein lark isoform X2 [Tetranychus urticae]|uniref:RNA-binding protein lark isoform X2 n=1 Tax=Tetranychus urticae TaxID=32264 RepID=UPI00077B8D44|nr:RNA-binding protein lark isoform X2 [Tetranychus urticae]